MLSRTRLLQLAGWYMIWLVGTNKFRVPNARKVGQLAADLDVGARDIERALHPLRICAELLSRDRDALKKSQWSKLPGVPLLSLWDQELCLRYVRQSVSEHFTVKAENARLLGNIVKGVNSIGWCNVTFDEAKLLVRQLLTELMDYHLTVRPVEGQVVTE
jgi:hypothetical protein